MRLYWSLANVEVRYAQGLLTERQRTYFVERWRAANAWDRPELPVWESAKRDRNAYGRIGYAGRGEEIEGFEW